MKNASSVEDLLIQGLGHHRARRLTEAANSYRTALSIQPDIADALNLLGAAQYQDGALEEGAALVRRAIVRNWRVATYHSNLGAVLQAAKRPRLAEEAYLRAVILDPALPDVLNNLGSIMLERAHLSEAEAILARAIRIKPDYAEARCNLGIIFLQLQRYGEAAEQLLMISQTRPDYPLLHNCLARLYREKDSPQAATRHFIQAILLAPGNSDFFQGYASFLLHQGRIGEARRFLDRALHLDPLNARAMNTMGNACHLQGRPAEAGRFFTDALALVDDLEIRKNSVLNMYFDPHYDQTKILSISKEIAAAIEIAINTASLRIELGADRKIRIGYVSGDYLYHPVGYFLSRVLPNHNRLSTEIFCYSNNFHQDEMTAALRSSSDHWRSIVGLTAEQAGRVIENDHIDVLVDLSGHTALNRLDVFALRPAPIQVSWLGFYGTTGMSRMDYILMDEVAIPRGDEHWFTEQVVRLPRGRFCYGPPDYAPEVASLPRDRNGYVTFGSFNRLAKINPNVIALWAEVLRAVPNSRLLLKCKTLGDESVRTNLLDVFASEGIPAHRIELRGKSPHRQMLEEYGEIDIALDPFPHCGGLTSCEALWMGVPVITLPGEHPVSRQTMGFLFQLELGFLVASSPRDYVSRAVALSSDVEKLGALRREIRIKMATSRP